MELLFVKLAVIVVDEVALVLLDCFTAKLEFEDVKVSTRGFKERSAIANNAFGINQVRMGDRLTWNVVTQGHPLGLYQQP